MAIEQQAFQDALAGNLCWGCGPTNAHGLQIKSYWNGAEAVCTFQPQPYHMAGPPHILNGGIIATLIDCHCVCTAMAAAYRTEGRAMDTAPPIYYATGSLHVTYLRPTPIQEPVVLHAQVKEMKERKTIITCSLFCKGEECARGEVVAVRVPATWRAAPPNTQ
jgi:acyl-coenzyme A thioesterase PaaI-like protein